MTREQQINEAAAKYCATYGIGEADVFDTVADFVEGAEWADQHPHWIPVEERLPEEQGKYMFRLSNGDMYYETYYPKLKLLDNVTHWMPIEPPRKEDKK